MVKADGKDIVHAIMKIVDKCTEEAVGSSPITRAAPKQLRHNVGAVLVPTARWDLVTGYR